ARGSGPAGRGRVRRAAHRAASWLSGVVAAPRASPPSPRRTSVATWPAATQRRVPVGVSADTPAGTAHPKRTTARHYPIECKGRAGGSAALPREQQGGDLALHASRTRGP